MRFLVSIATMALLLIACGTTKPVDPRLLMTEAQTQAAVKKAYPADQLKIGKALWQAKCSRCHELYKPDTRTVNQWERVLPRMAQRARITNVDANLVRAYLMVNAKVAPSPVPMTASSRD